MNLNVLIFISLAPLADNGEELARLQAVESSEDKSASIPGLNYKTKQTKPAPFVPVEPSQALVKQPLLPTPPRHQAPPSSLPAAPIMNRPPMPGPPPQRFHDPYRFMMPPPPPPPGMGPLPPRLPYPPLAPRSMFPMQGMARSQK